MTENVQGGIWCRIYACKVSVTDSAVAGNGTVDLKNEGSEDWHFTRVYLGKAASKLLKSRGDTANLPSVIDGQDAQGSGRLRIAEFLNQPPEKCGSTIEKIGKRSVR